MRALTMSCEDPFDDDSWLDCPLASEEADESDPEPSTSEDPTLGSPPDAAGAAADRTAAREAAGDDPDACTGCGHPRAAHPTPYGACEQCLVVVTQDDSHVVCGVFRRD